MTTTDPTTKTGRVFPRLRSKTAHPLTNDQVANLARKVSDDPEPLDPDDLACADCGQIVAGPIAPAAVIYAQPDAVSLPGGGVSSSVAGVEGEPLTVCSTCRDRQALADSLTDDLLPNGITMDKLHLRGNQARGVVRHALAAIAALGMQMPRADHIDAEVLVLTVRRMTPVGASLAWQRRYSPIRSRTAVAHTANPRPWAHIHDDTRANLRAAYAHLMADRLARSAPSVALAPPPLPAELGHGVQAVGGGCLLCGVGQVTVTALDVARAGGRDLAARNTWLRMDPIGADSLGARPSPARVVGHLCPVCAGAFERVRSVGPSLLERSLLRNLDLADNGQHELPGLVAWAGIVADRLRAGLPAPAANATPWSHLGDLGALREQIVRAQ